MDGSSKTVKDKPTETWKDTVRCMYTNVDTINTKKDELAVHIAQMNPDIVGLTEINPKNATWELQLQDVQINGYDAYVNFSGRGSVLYVKSSFNSYEVNMKKSSEASVWCTVKLKGKDKLLVGLVYRSPNSTDLQDEQLRGMIKEAVQKGHSHIMIMGDFNYPEIDWKSETSSATNGHSSHDFLAGCKDSFLFQHVQQPTRYRAEQTANVLDLLFTNEEGMIEEVHYGHPVGSSDHLLLDWSFKCYTVRQSRTFRRYQYDRGDYEEMRRQLGEVDWKSQLQGKDVEDMWAVISREVEESVNAHIPCRTVVVDGKTRNRRPLWMNERAMERLRRKKVAFRHYLETKEGNDYKEYTKERNAAKNEVRRAVRDYQKEIAVKAKKNPKEFYKYVNSKLRTRTGVADLKKSDGTEIRNDKEKAEEFNGFFVSVFTQEDCNNMPPSVDKKTKKGLDDIEFSESDIMQMLLKTNVSKSPGPDEVHPRVLKECAKELAAPLTVLYRASLDGGCLPKAWKDGNITPIFKKGSRADVGNYRPVSLTAIPCKVFEKLIRNALLQHMFENDFISEFQHGFVRGRSCTTQLLQVMDKWTEILDQGGSVDSIYLDFAKAFDSVPHKRLLLKLEGYGVGGRVLGWIKDFLMGRRQRVMIAGEASRWAEVVSGVPQGSVLGPVLFVCYINDMPETISSMIYMYADDTKIAGRVDNEEEVKILQSDLDKLVDWSQTWQMKFNVQKCKVMHIGNRNSKADYKMANSQGERALAETTEEKDLGVWVTKDMKSAVAVAHAASKANQLLGLIKRCFSYLDIHLVKQLYTVMIRPHLEYGNVIWHPQYKKEIDLLESVQHRATRMVPGFWKIDYQDRLRKMRLPSLVFRRLRGDAIEVYKHLHGIYKVESGDILPRDKREGMVTRGHSLKLKKRDCRTSVRANALGFRVVNFWNSLPEEVVNATSVNAFKNGFDRLSDMLDIQYSCSPDLGRSGVRTAEAEIVK